MNNMACGVLTVWDAFDYTWAVLLLDTATGRVFSYNPDRYLTTLTGDDWPGAMGTILPGGFAVANNKSHPGRFNINVGSTNQIWEFDPTAAAGQMATEGEHAGRDHVCTDSRDRGTTWRSIGLPGWR
jgi:hypothetical protein